METGRILVVSYSYSGNTYRIAEEICRITDGDLCELYLTQPYPMQFSELLDKVRKEIRAKYKPPLLAVPHSPRNYDIIFAGSPVWCGTIAPPLYSWLSRNNLSGKVIMPFCSHCGEAVGNMSRDVKKLCPKSDVRETLSIFNDGGKKLVEEIVSWLEKNEIGIPSVYQAG